jgi:acylphosphatase
VQGVGFRWFVCREAEALGLGGYVRNLPSGQVEVVAAGEKGLIDELVKTLRAGPRFASVSDVQLQEIDLHEEFHDFGIR